mmetsp:Transcript_15682/g.21996  ORF Transcript_15682/g.21996 Transcript_15682/m.21996 type:complete len:408 (+) Transcript_15682:87-1310(+)
MMSNEGNNSNDDSPTLLSKSMFFDSNAIKAVEVINNSQNLKNDGMIQRKKSPPGFLTDVTIFLKQLDLGHHAENLKKIGYCTVASLKNLTIRQLLGWDWCYAEANRLLAAIRAYISSIDEKDGSGGPSGESQRSSRKIQDDCGESNETGGNSNNRKRSASTYRPQETDSQNSSPTLTPCHSKKPFPSSSGQEMKGTKTEARMDIAKKRKIEDERDSGSRELLETRHRQINIGDAFSSSTDKMNPHNSTTVCSLSSSSKPIDKICIPNEKRGGSSHNYNERKRLEYALDVLGANAIKAILKIHVASGSDGVRKVAAVLTPELAPAVSRPLALCFRCGNRFDPQYKSKCVMPHPTEAVEFEEVDVTLGDKRYDFKCSLCSKIWQSERSHSLSLFLFLVLKVSLTKFLLF